MAKCQLCSKKKGKRYCSPLDKTICPLCCAENRMVKVTCNEDCRYLEGVSFQEKRSEDKAFSELMNNVGHGQFDDIFQKPAVALMAYKVECLLHDIYVDGEINITDTQVYESLKKVYVSQFQDRKTEQKQLDELTIRLLEQYDAHSPDWKANMDEEMVGKVYLRLMISIRKMSGGRMGEYGYLNYLKNNLESGPTDGEFIVEDKFGDKELRKSSQ
jgi:hypothetical protein